MKRRIVTVMLAAGLLMAGCHPRAPTTYELDRRAGLPIPGDKSKDDDGLAQMRTSSAVARAPHMPVKVPPLIERVWVSDLALSEDARLQGTWMFLEVERGHWLDEVDPGGGPLLAPAPKGAPLSRGPKAPLSRGLDLTLEAEAMR